MFALFKQLYALTESSSSSILNFFLFSTTSSILTGYTTVGMLIDYPENCAIGATFSINFAAA